MKTWVNANFIQLFDIVSIIAKIRAAEKHCRNLHDYFRLIQRVSGHFKTTTPIAAQKETEIVNFLEAASRLPLESVLEIGTGFGGTFYLLCKATKPDATLLTIDPQNDWKRAILLKSYARVGQKLHVIRGNSRERTTLEKVVRALGSRRLDLLLIDGDHSFAAVSGDFELYTKLVRQGGIVGIHDIVPDYRTRYGIETSNYTGDVPRFWDTIKTTCKIEEFVENYDQDGFGIGVVHWESS